MFVIDKDNNIIINLNNVTYMKVIKEPGRYSPCIVFCYYGNETYHLQLQTVERCYSVFAQIIEAIKEQHKAIILSKEEIICI